MSDGEINENGPSPLIRRMSIRRNRRRPTQRIVMPVEGVVRQPAIREEMVAPPPPPSPNPPVNINIHRMIHAFDVEPLLPPLEMPEYLQNAIPNLRHDNNYPIEQFAEERAALIEAEDEDEEMNENNEENGDGFRVEFFIQPLEYRGFFRNFPFRGPDRRGVVIAGNRAGNNAQARFIRHPRVHNARRGQASIATQTEPVRGRNRNALNNTGRNNTDSIDMNGLSLANAAGTSGNLEPSQPNVCGDERMEDDSENAEQ